MAESQLCMQSAIDVARHRGGRALGAAGALHQDAQRRARLAPRRRIAGGSLERIDGFGREVIASPVDASDLTYRNFTLEEARWALE